MKWSFNFFFIWLVFGVNAQDAFVTFVNNDVSKLGIYDIIYDEEFECYFTLGNKIDSLNGLWIAKFNKHGELINENYFFGDTLYNFQLERRNNLIKVDSNLYFTSGILAFSQSQQYELFFDSDLEIITYKETPPFTEGLTKFNFSSTLYDDNIFLTGTNQKDNFEIDTYVKRLNIDGEEVWKTEIGTDDGHNDRYTSITIFDTLIIVGTTKRAIGSSIEIKSSCQITFISPDDGSIIRNFILNLPNSRNVGPTNVIPFSANGKELLAFGCTESIYDPLNNSFNGQLRYFITDLDGNVEDSIRLGNVGGFFSGLFNNDYVKDGFITSGQLYFEDRASSYPVLGKLDIWADTTWWSILDFNETNDYYEGYSITGQTILPDESIVLCGNLIEYKIPTWETYRERPFILKLDSDGCLEPGCRETVSNNVTNSDAYYFLAPNPSRGSFSIDGEHEDIQLFDVVGNKIPIQKSNHGEKTLVKVPSFKNGIHYVVFATGKDLIQRKIMLINL